MNAEEVLRLAKLARIEVSGEEAESLSHEFEAILGYVGEVKKISSTIEDDQTEKPRTIRNVLRADDTPHESGVFSEAILQNAPSRQGDYIGVKKIL